MPMLTWLYMHSKSLDPWQVYVLTGLVIAIISGSITFLVAHFFKRH